VTAGRRRGRRRVTGRGRLARRDRCALLTVPVGLGLEELLELATVEEYPTALAALVDGYATALVGTHLAATLRTGHLHL
jgi:hypothetical protein